MLVVASTLLCLGTETMAAEMKVKFSGTTAIAIAHLADTESCGSNSRATVVGHIVKREFGDNGVRLQNFVYEGSDGSRGVINVDFDDVEKNQGMAGLSNALLAVQQLTKVGRRFRADVFLCGAAGRVLMLENLS
jgi:hypothetical protein